MSTLTRMDSHTPGPGECFFMDHEFGSKSPPRKQQRVQSFPVSANSREGVMPYPAQSEVRLSGNPVRTLWELKGIKWPSTVSNSEVSETGTCSVTSSQQTKHLAPATMQEEEEHLKTALIESCMNTVYQPLAVDDSSIITAVDASEKIPLSDAASALMDLSDFGCRQKYYYH